jgi:hypothetical protein
LTFLAKYDTIKINRKNNLGSKMDEGFGDREGQFGSNDRIETKTPQTSDDWMGSLEGQFGSSNQLTSNPVLDEPWGDRETHR